MMAMCEFGMKRPTAINFSRACLLEFVRDGSVDKRQGGLAASAIGAVGGPCDGSWGCDDGRPCVGRRRQWRRQRRVEFMVVLLFLLARSSLVRSFVHVLCVTRPPKRSR